MEYFVDRDSVVRRIWGKGDTILFIFAGAAAEFALNKAVDWLYFTGKLPSDPIGRLFSTVSYARKIVFSDFDSAMKAIDTITAIHSGVEKSRGAKIPDWAYRDVLFMLIDYSVRSYELLERQLTTAEKEEVFNVFNRVGLRMGLVGLPANFDSYLLMRHEHLKSNMIKSEFTRDLFGQYRKHLGAFRYRILIESQKLVVPEEVSKMAGFGKIRVLQFLIPVYNVSRLFKLDLIIKTMLIPARYRAEIRSLDVAFSE